MTIDPVGASIGAASLAIQLLDTAAAGYALFIAAGNMNESCLELRTKLEVEQCRLLAFAEIAGLLDWTETDPLPKLLRAEKLVVIAVLTQIGCKLDDFSAMTNRYTPLRADDSQTEAEQDIKARQTGTDEVLTTLQSKWDASVRKSETRKEHLMGTNHIFKWAKTTKNIATNPKSLWWAAFDEKKFRSILAQLTEFTNYLHELMHDLRAKESDEVNRKSYLELVLVRNDIQDLKRLFISTTLVSEHNQQEKTPYATAANVEFSSLIGSLVDAKTRSIEIDMPDKDKPPSYIEAVGVAKTKLKYQNVTGYALPPNPLPLQRFRGVGHYQPNESLVWVEWKPYRFHLDHKTRSQVPFEGNVRRVQELVSLLQNHTVPAFRVPKCRGYIDYREDKEIGSGDSKHAPLFGLVFEYPEKTIGGSKPVSLLDLVQESECPSLSARVQLAHRITESVLYLHAVQWLHKGIRSDGIIFFPLVSTKQVEISNPYMAGFEYSRPDKIGSSSTHIPPDPHNDAYMHPLYQGKDKFEYCKSFDIYSLGIVLLEIAIWQSIHALVEKDISAIPKDGDSEDKPAKKIWDKDDVYKIREVLLNEKSTCITKLKRIVGDRYYTAVEICIRGILPDPRKEAEFEVKLQRDFTEKVVENLGTVAV